MDKRKDNSEAPYVETDVIRPRCPTCLSFNLYTNHTKDQGDGSLLRWRHCKNCGQRLREVAWLPEDFVS